MRKLSLFGSVSLHSGLILATLAAMVMPLVLPAQSTALLSGTVIDTSEAVIPEVRVDCENTQTGVKYSTTTTAGGIFRFPSLPIGEYSLIVTHAGFQELVRSGIVLLTGHSVDVTLTLEVGNTLETVTVTAPAPVVQRTASVLQTTMNSKSVRDLPLNGRNALQLVSLAAGSIQSGSSHNWQGANSQYSVNGNRGTDNTFSLDGVSYTDPHWHNAPILPNPDALEEFTVKSSNFDASQLGSGANVQYSMRSGTNQIHGSLFEFLRNDTLDARNFFADEVTPFKRNQFGGTVGGPIIRDKTFFFASFQATRVRGGSSPAIMTIPSTQLRAGDFTSLGKSIIDPLSGQPFANNRIPTNRMDPINLKLLDTIPIPGQATGVARVPVKPRTDENDNQVSIKIDHNISSKDRLSGHWFYDRLNFQVPTSELRAYYADTIFRNQNFMISNTHTFSPNLLMVTSFGYTSVPREQAPVPPPATMQELGVNVPFSTDGVGPEIRVFINGYSSLANGGRLVVQPTVQQYRERVTWLRSNHMIQFGGDVTRSTEYAFTPAQGSGNWFYDGSKTASPSMSPSGDSFADFLVGSPFLFRQQGASPQDIAATLWAPWITDDWKVSPRLTLNLGVRWDPGLPPTDRYGPQTGFVAGTQSAVAPGAPLGLVYSGDPGLRHSILPADWNNLAPRVGFAWDVTGRGSTIVRSAYGIFYRPDLLNITRFSSNTAAGRGLVIAFAPANVTDPYAAFPAGNPFPAWRAPVTPEDFKTFNFPNPVSTSAFDPNTRSSYVQQWNLTVERQIVADLGLSLAYVGNRIVKGVSSTEGNPALYRVGATAGNAPSRRPYAGIASLQSVSGFQNANYHGLQFTVTKRAAQGLNLLGNYTYSKCMDNNSATIGSVSVINKLDPNQDYARCDFNITHVGNLSFEFSLPQVRSFQGVFDKVLNHWELTSIFSVQSGNPFTVRSGVQNSLSGPTTNSGTNDAADQISANSARPAGADELTQWFNTAAFVRNALGTYGNSGRNSIVGPGGFNWDFGLAKHIPVAETVNVEFRFEAFNFLNHANFGNPNTVQNSALFGKITSASEPRVIQVALKLNF